MPSRLLSCFLACLLACGPNTLLIQGIGIGINLISYFIESHRKVLPRQRLDRIGEILTVSAGDRGGSGVVRIGSRDLRMMMCVCAQ